MTLRPLNPLFFLNKNSISIFRTVIWRVNYASVLSWILSAWTTAIKSHGEYHSVGRAVYVHEVVCSNCNNTETQWNGETGEGGWAQLSVDSNNGLKKRDVFERYTTRWASWNYLGYPSINFWGLPCETLRLEFFAQSKTTKKIIFEFRSLKIFHRILIELRML